MYIKRNTLFFPDIEKGKTDAKLRMRIRWDKKTVNFNLGHRIIVNKWNKESQRYKHNAINEKKVSATIINSKIQFYQDKSEDTFKLFELENKIPNVQEFRIAFNKILGKTDTPKEQKKDFYSLFDKFTQEMGQLNNWKESTYKKFKTIKGHLQSFNENLSFEYLDENGLSQLVYFLRDEKDYRDSTIGKYLSFVKWFLKWSIQKNYSSNKDFEVFKPKLKTSNSTIIYLDWDELMSVYKKDIPSEHQNLEKVRDVFCFCCFTSLRYSDVANLKKSNIYENHIEFTTVKTSDALIINLNNYSSAILEKYKDYESKDHHAFPVLSNQKMNTNLKKLAEICELDRPITQTYFKGNERVDEVSLLYQVISTHAARRTFISNALILGIPPQTVMQWTGHSDYSAMKPYIAIADKEKAKAMELFNR